jgi:rhamnogalacturonyl hydrolase YesR
MAKNKIKGISESDQKKALEAGLLGADWFVNNQIDLAGKTCRDANGGRYMYNGHIYSDYQTMGIDWTMARALFVLQAAFKATKDQKYLDSVAKGLKYIYSLQVMDKRDKSLYGVFHEETPQSYWIYPRDGIELADALFEYYLITGDKEALFRADAFMEWFVKETIFKLDNGLTWVYRRVDFDGKKDERLASCEGGNTMALAHAFKITGKKKYKKAMKRIMDAQIELYHQAPGPFVDSDKEKNHHVSDGGHIDNDDGAGVGLLCAYDILESKKYLEHAKTLADYHLSKNGNYNIICAFPAVSAFLLEMSRTTGDIKYAKGVTDHLDSLLKLQHIDPKNKNSHGAFIGEDEGGINYVPNHTPKPQDMVTTRTTAFACLSLFKIAGQGWPLGYSVH